MRMREQKSIRPIAFYLPQYHPIPENDQWWGRGFTEWTNTVKARPLFKGHYQPHLPADLGFYDLRLPEVREAQANLAREYGIYGFCYYHYWFNGKRVLERPFNEVQFSGRPEFPFCLCWANENWSRNWNGDSKSILLKQNYSEEDDRRHIRWLADAFRDGRYIRIEGKPLMLIYKTSHLPNPQRTAEIWREECRRMGIGEIYLCKVESSFKELENPEKLGFDASVEFQPDWAHLGEPQRRGIFWRALGKLGLSDCVYRQHGLFDYRSLIENSLRKKRPVFKRFPCVTPSWDNSPRRSKDASIFINATPDLYEKWLKGVIDKFTPYSPEENIVFINAWNEWAEGNHLEPCQKWGRAYLEATRNAVCECAAELEKYPEEVYK